MSHEYSFLLTFGMDFKIFFCQSKFIYTCFIENKDFYQFSIKIHLNDVFFFFFMGKSYYVIRNKVIRMRVFALYSLRDLWISIFYFFMGFSFAFFFLRAMNFRKCTVCNAV